MKHRPGFVCRAGAWPAVASHRLRTLHRTAALLLIASGAAQGATWYVDADAPGPANGLTWQTAFKNPQAALAAAGPNDTIRVAKGTYMADGGFTPVGGSHTAGTGLRTATFQLKNGVALYGGYAGLGAPAPDLRDIVLHETILSGDLAGDDAPVACAQDSPDCGAHGWQCANGTCIIPDQNDENSYHVVTGSAPFAPAILDGFTITGGNADGEIPLNWGSGMFNPFSSKPTVINCTFSGNSAVVGGGMYNDANSRPAVSNCTFSGNSALLGAGMSNYQSSPTVTNCTFTLNSTDGIGGGMHNNSSSPTVTHCAFIENTAFSGGGMSSVRGSPSVTNCMFSGNSAAWDGGGMYNYDNSPSVINCTFSGNLAGRNGGGMFNDNAGSPIVTNSIFWRNSDAGGIDESGQIHTASGTPVVNYSDVQGGWSGAGGVGNFDADPLFVDANGRDNILGTLDDDLRLLPGSPAIDSARNENVPVGVTTDLAGKPRFIDDPNAPDCPLPGADCGIAPIVDMGAYEFGGDDCNFNGIPDACDLDCGAQGGVCDVPSCGLSNDGNLNGILDECQHILYVDDDGSATNNCASWIDACPNLQMALGMARRGDEIWVATGTYAPAGPGGNRTATFQLLSGVRVYGGFAGTESTLEERAGLFDQTILTGDLSGDDAPVPCVASIPDCEMHRPALCFNGSCIIKQGSGENSYHVVTGSGTDGSAVLDGFTIKAGNANGADSNSGGSGMYNVSSSPTVTNCTFSGNSALGLFAASGGGMYNVSSSPTLTNCTFSNNSADSGGGMFNYSSSSPTVTNCTFSGNSANNNGGGMYNFSSSPTLTNCTFSNNSADSGGGMINVSSSPTVTFCTFSANAGGNGGGMYNFSSSSTVTNCTFSGNSANHSNGGGMYNTNSSPAVTNCTFSDNSASDFGGGMRNTNSSPAVTNCTFSGNSASGPFAASGGGMSNFSSSPTVTNCTFSGNSANNNGGGMINNSGSSPTLTNCTFSNNSADSGGGMYNYLSSPTLTNCTFSNNSADSGGGMINFSSSPTVTNCTFSGNSANNSGGGMYNTNSSPAVTNCILWGNSPHEIFNVDPNVGTPSVAFSDVQGGLPAGTIDGGGNIDADPLFADADLRLGAGSPCIDAADNSAVTVSPDLDGNVRIVDNPGTPDCPQAPGTCGTPPIVDMGAYEFGSLPCGLADLDCDGDVDLHDFARFQACFAAIDPLACNPTATPDLDGDGQVDLDDYALFRANLNGPGL